MSDKRCILCHGSGLLPGVSRGEQLCPLCDGIEGWPQMLPSLAEMNRTGEVGDAVAAGVAFREIRAIHDEETVRVYQAYNAEIVVAACAANSFRAPLESGMWSASRMTWIKPSAVWMAYRCGWTVMKDKNQGAVVALDVCKRRFLELLKTAVLSHGHGGEAGATKACPVVVQWDPERLMSTTAGRQSSKTGMDKDAHTRDVPEMRSIQIGLRGQAVETLLDPQFLVRITDVTASFRQAHAALTANPPNMAEAVAALWPERAEERLIVPRELRDLLHMDAP